MNIPKTVEMLNAEEDCVLTAYPDTEGIWTIGIGHNLEAGGLSKEEASQVVWTQEQADTQLSIDLAKVQEALNRVIPWWNDLADARKAVLAGMAFQLGVTGLLGFKLTLKAVKAGSYSQAAAFMLDSKWAKQTHNRAMRMAEMMITGEFLLNE